MRNKTKRLKWAKEYKNWTGTGTGVQEDVWKRVLWTDESKFEVFGSKRRKYVRQRPNEKMLKQCITPSVKHGGGSVMIWGCFGATAVGDLHRVQGIGNQHGYRSILQQHAIPSGKRLIGANSGIQQDNDPKHASKF